MMKFQQAPRAILMVRPAAFGFNSETASSNAFQQNTGQCVHDAALREFDRMVAALISHDVKVLVADDNKEPQKPDAIFPNNWISFHEDGRIVLYPMMTENRRAERRTEIIDRVKTDFKVLDVVDFSAEEKHGKIVEGTGSLVFDHVNKIAFASRSPRTDESLVRKISAMLSYQPMIFDSADENGTPVYHTNVLLCVGERFVTICLDAISSENDQEMILDQFARSGHKVVAISFEQMKAFAGNMIEVRTRNNEPLVVMSETAQNVLLPGQLNAISQFADILPVSIPEIQKTGGGSVRCMVAGIHLPALKPE